MMKNYPYGLAFPPELMQEVRDRFLYLTEDRFTGHRQFFDNAGGSFRLKSAEKHMRSWMRSRTARSVFTKWRSICRTCREKEKPIFAQF